MHVKRALFGFTLLEVLVVVLIIGILSSIGVYGLNVSRAMNRDTKRISDISILRAALTQHWLQTATYPQREKTDLGRAGANSDKLGSSGFLSLEQTAPIVFLQRVPLGPKVGEYYQYHGSNKGYSIKFVTEKTTIYGSAGIWYAHADGIDKDDAEK